MKNPLKNHKGFKDRKKKRVKNKPIKSATNIMHSQTNPVKQHDQMLFKQSSDLDHKITAFSQTPQQIQANSGNPDEEKSKKNK